MEKLGSTPYLLTMSGVSPAGAVPPLRATPSRRDRFWAPNYNGMVRHGMTFSFAPQQYLEHDFSSSLSIAAGRYTRR
jgi:hypothetical protein